ncbi:MAG: RagB/SusD family nutrient uptake outer membrane protein [Chitinophagaceae bacterium]
MKNIKYTYYLAAIFLLITSCKKDYLETLPTDAVNSESVFTSTANAMAALNGIHKALYNQYLSNQDQGGQGSIMIYMDMLGDDLVMTAQGTGWFNATYRWEAHRNASANTQPTYFAYYFYYRIIINANNIINNIDKAEGPDAEKKAIKGEALTYRAWAHFMLVQLYGKRYDATTKPNAQLGVPLKLASTTEGQPRVTVEEVYAQINKDLDDAITNLAGYSRANKSHFNLSVAKGVKARVALTQQNWADAAKFASEAKQGYSLMNNEQYVTGFNDYSNPEWMWGSHQVPEQTTFFYSFYAFMSANYNSGAIRTNPKAINSTLYNQISATDVRKKLWDVTGASVPVPPNGLKRPYINKKFLVANTSSSAGDVPNMRAAEMYLIEAEARARLGQDGAAADVLSTLLLNRDPAYVKSASTGQALIDEIFVHRRVELWGEGFRFLDLKRTNSSLDRTGANHDPALARILTMPAGDNQWEFLLPQAELDANKAAVQNPL